MEEDHDALMRAAARGDQGATMSFSDSGESGFLSAAGTPVRGAGPVCRACACEREIEARRQRGSCEPPAHCGVVYDSGDEDTWPENRMHTCEKRHTQDPNFIYFENVCDVDTEAEPGRASGHVPDSMAWNDPLAPERSSAAGAADELSGLDVFQVIQRSPSGVERPEELERMRAFSYHQDVTDGPDGWTPLMHAVYINKPGMVEILLECSVPNDLRAAENTRGHTALHLAVIAAHPNPDVVLSLVNARAVLQRNNDGWSPLDYARGVMSGDIRPGSGRLSPEECQAVYTEHMVPLLETALKQQQSRCADGECYEGEACREDFHQDVEGPWPHPHVLPTRTCGRCKLTMYRTPVCQKTRWKASLGTPHSSVCKPVGTGTCGIPPSFNPRTMGMRFF